MNNNFIYLKHSEPQLFYFWETLTEEKKIAFRKQIQNINIEKLKKQKQLLQLKENPTDSNYESIEDLSYSGNKNLLLLGQNLIKKGKVGCLLLAGGQGTRLHFSGPKGIFPITIVKQKSLFQLCAEKVLSASQWAGLPLSLAIMTSPENDKETRDFFCQHHYFGLDPSQIFFFIQETLPLLNSEGKLFLKSPWQLSSGPDGNGNSLLYFASSNILEKWLKNGIEYINTILIDNPLADPFDAELVGFHHHFDLEITLKCIEKLSPEEKLGVLVRKNGKLQVVEYSELSNEEKREKQSNGRLKYHCANLSLFCISSHFIYQMVSKKVELPLHKAWKRGEIVDKNGNTYLSKEPIAWKFETFIFDWLLYTQKVAPLVYPRERCFAPLKNFSGPDSPETVRKALQDFDKKIFEDLTEMTAPHFPFELATDFYYPTPFLLSKWRGRCITTSYVQP